jgi:hypothetical protein
MGMDFFILAIAVVLLSLFLSAGLLIVFINCGVFPRPEADDFVGWLYWRKDSPARRALETATVRSLIAGLAEWPVMTAGTENAVFLREQPEETYCDFIPKTGGVAAAGKEALILAA